MKYATDALQSGWISSHGKYKKMSEDLLCEQFDCAHALLVSNGTCATHLLAKALQFRHPNINRIIAPNNCYVAAWNSFLFDGYDWKIQLIDSDLKTWNADYSNVDADENTAFLIVPNLGNMINVSTLKKLYPRSVFVEDNCEGFFGLYNNKRAGSESECMSLSFFGNKDLTSGEGGAVLTSSDSIHEYIRKIHSQGQSKERYIHDEIGYNYRMSNVLAAIGVAQMEVIEERIKRTREVNEIYQKEVGDLFYSFQEERSSDRSNMWLTCALMKGENKPQDLIAHLAEDNIEARRLWKPMHEQPVMQGYKKYINGNSSLLFLQGICLPSGSDLTKQDMKRIIKSIKTFFKNDNL